MPDITMCPSTTCPYKERCYRNKESGTTPSQRQSWFMGMKDEGDDCHYFWPVTERNKK